MRPLNPCDDMPSVDTEECDMGDCHEPWAWEADRRNGPRMLRLCEDHATRWLEGERVLAAEREEVAGRDTGLRMSMAPLFALARALDGRAAKGRRSA